MTSLFFDDVIIEKDFLEKIKKSKNIFFAYFIIENVLSVKKTNTENEHSFFQKLFCLHAPNRFSFKVRMFQVIWSITLEVMYKKPTGGGGQNVPPPPG